MATNAILPHVGDETGPKRPATYEDVLQAPEHMVAEVVDGELYLSPRPAPRHAIAGSVLGGTLISPFQQGRGGPGGWWILDEPELHLADDIVVPDIAGWHRVRMARIPATAYFPLAPDWVCEILSPSTMRFDRDKKLDVYGRERVSHAWLVDPIARTLEVLVRTGANWSVHRTHREAGRIRAVPFEAIEIELADLWVEPA